MFGLCGLGVLGGLCLLLLMLDQLLGRRGVVGRTRRAIEDDGALRCLLLCPFSEGWEWNMDDMLTKRSDLDDLKGGLV
jgi:hypothetical protein